MTNSQRLAELRKKRKEEEKKSSSTSTSENKTYKNSERLKKLRLERNIGFDTFESDLNSMGTTIQGIYDGWQTQDTMSKTKTTVEAMQARINAYQDYQKIFGGADLSEIANKYQTILGDWDNRTTLYGQYKDADSYTKEKAKMSELDAMGLEDIEPYLKDEKNNIAYTTVGGKNITWQSLYDEKKDAKMSTSKEGKLGYEEFVKLEKEAKEKAEKEEAEKSWFVKAVEMIGSSPDTTLPSAMLTQVVNDKSKDDSYKKPRKNWTQEELNTFGAYWYEKDYEGAYNYATRVNNAKALEEKNSTKEKIEGSATSGFGTVGHWAGSILASPFGMVDYLDDLTDIAAGREVLVEEGIVTPFEYSQTVNSSQSKALNDWSGTLNEDIPVIGGKGIGDVYGLGTSVAQSALSAYALGPAGTAVSYFGQSAASAVDDAVERGATPEQALIYGSIAGAAEAVSEYIGADRLLNIGSSEIKNAFIEILKQSGAEGIEETFSASIENIADNFVMQDKSAFNIKVQQYVLQGLSEEEATKKAWTETVEEITYNGLSGFVSGGLHSTAPVVIGTARENKNIGSNIRNNERVTDMLDIAGLTPQESDAYKAYTRYAQKGITADNVTDKQLGKLYNAVDTNARKTLSSKKTSVEQKTEAFETMAKLSKVNTENKAAKISKELTKNGVAEENSVTSSGENIDIAGIKLGEDTKVVTADGKEISLSDITPTQRDADLLSQAQLMSESDANLFIEQYDGQTDVSEYADSFNLVKALSEHSYTQDYVLEHRGVLTPQQAGEVYIATRVEIAKNQSKEAKETAQAQQKEIDTIIAKWGNTMTVQGNFDDSIIDYNSTTTDGSKVNWDSLTQTQRGAIKFTKLFSKATGVNIKFIKNEVATEGKNKGEYVGKNGSYDPATNTIEIDVYAGRIDAKALNDSIIPTLSHEITHWMKYKMPALYNSIREDVLKTLSTHDGTETNDKRIAAEMVRMKKNHSDMEVTSEDAIDELVARACEDMLSNSNAARKLLAKMGASEQQSFIEKVKETFDNLIKWINDLLAHYKSNSEEAKILREYKNMLKKISKQWDAMLLGSIESNQALKKEGITGEELAKSTNKDVKHSHRDVEKGKKRYYNELNSLAMQWAYSASTNVGDTKIFNDRGKSFLVLEATEDGYIEIARGSYEEVKEFEQLYKAENEGFDRYAETYESLEGTSDSGLWKSPNREMFGRNSRTTNSTQEGIKGNTSTENAEYVFSDNKKTSAEIKRSDRDTDTFSRIQTLQIAVNELRNTLTEMQNSEDFKVAHDKLSEAISNGDVENGIKIYEEWQEKSGYAELSQRRDTLQLELENLRKSFNEEIADKALNEEKEAIAKSGLSEADYFRKQAVKEFGYTPYFYDAGYITPNGKMLNFSGEKGKHYGTRGQDHRAIGIIYANTEGTAALNRFMKDGNVRIMAESPGIDISTLVEPTTEQYSTIKKFIYEYADKEYFNVDLSDENGNVIGSLEYENKINPSRIINDIKHYYATGEIREQSNIDKFRYSDRDTAYMDAVNNKDADTLEILVKEAAEKAMPNSKVRDENGNLRLVYHGRVSEFNVFDRFYSNIEGDFGKGFYFTSNEYDVDENYANEEGPDLKNKIAREAERLEWEDEYADLSYEEREEIVRERMITSEPNTITAYLNMENPVYITPNEKGTFLDFNEEYDEEYDEYGEPEGLLVDFIEALNNNAMEYSNGWREVDFSFLYEDAYDGGIYAADAVQKIKNRIIDELADDEGNLAISEVIRLAFEDIGFDGIIDTSVYYKFRNMNGMDSSTTHYIVFNSNQIKEADLITYDNNGNVIPLSERFNTANEDIRYSDRDSEGNELSKEQQDFFANSKVRDKNGNLVVCYHGTDAKFTVFDKSKINSSNGAFYGKGFYFSNSKSAANQYGNNVYEYYLNITNPLYLDDENWVYDLGIEKKKESLKVIDAKLEETRKGFYTVHYKDSSSPNTWKSLDRITKPQIDEYGVYGFVERRINPKPSILPRDVKDIAYLAQEKGYDGIIGNGTNITDFGTVEYVVFDENQIKSTSNINPTSNPDIRYSDRDNVSVYDTMGETDRLIKENTQLKEDVERLKERLKLEKQITNGNHFNENQLDAVAAHIRNIAKSNYSKSELVNLLKGVYSYIATSKDLNWQDMFAQCYDIASMVLNEARPVTETNEYYKWILNDIRGTKISVNEQQIQNARYKLGNRWRNSFFNKVKITDNAISLDRQWQEWSAAYPDLFDAEISDADMLVELYDIYDSVREGSELVVEYDTEEQTRWLAREIYNQYWNVSPVRTTAEKYDKQIKLLNYKHREAMNQLRNNYEDRLKSQHKADRQKAINLVKEIRNRKDKEIAEVKKHSKERMDAYKDNAARKTKIQSITAKALSLSEWLLKNSKEKHIHESLKGPVANLLQAIDFSSKQLLGMRGGDYSGMPTRKDISLQKALSQVKDMMLEASVGKEELVDLYGHDLDDDIKLLVESVDNIMRTVGDNEFILNKMTLNDLNTLDNMLKTIKQAVTKMNQFHSVHHAQGIASLGQEEIRYAEKLGNEKIYVERSMKSDSKKMLKWHNSVPYYAFKRFGEAGKKIFEAFQDGWDKLSFNVKEVIDFTKKTYTSKEVKAWEKEIKSFDVRVPATDSEKSDPNFKPKSQKVQMTTAQVMYLYLLNKRAAAKAHLLGGGIVVSNIETKKSELISQPEGVLLEQSEIDKIIQSLNKRQIEVADALSKFMNTVCSDWGNEVSIARFGYKAFGEPDYVPMQVDKDEISTADPAEKNNSLFKLLNMSFTKGLTEGANNRLVISSIFDVFAQHTSDMAKYNALALPVLDAFKWYNYKEIEYVGEEAKVRNTVKKSIGKAFGKDGQNYITTLLEDINGQNNVSRDTLSNRFFKNSKLASVGMNLRVILLQPTSYFRASANIDNKYLIKALAHKPKIAHAEKYCGMALWKSLGYYDTNIQRGVAEQIKHAETPYDKVVEWSMKGAGEADRLTLGYLWNASELEIRKTRKDLKVGSEEFFLEVGKRLRDIIYSTQVVDSTLTRSQMMRSADKMDKVLTAFMSEPTLAYNILQDAYIQTGLDARELGSKKAAFKKNGKKIAKAITAYTVTNAVAALVESGFDALRDDDDEEMDIAEFMKLYLANFAADMSIVGKVPYLKDGLSILQGYSPSRSDLQWIESAYKTYTGITKHLQGEGNPVTTIKNSLKTFSYVSGLPFFNAYRDAMAALDKLDILSSEELEEMFKDLFGIE